MATPKYFVCSACGKVGKTNAELTEHDCKGNVFAQSEVMEVFGQMECTSEDNRRTLIECSECHIWFDDVNIFNNHQCAPEMEPKDESSKLKVSAEEKEEPAADNTCKICMEDSEIDCIFIPCGHMVACLSCGNKMNRCPICRVEVQVQRVYKC